MSNTVGSAYSMKIRIDQKISVDSPNHIKKKGDGDVVSDTSSESSHDDTLDTTSTSTTKHYNRDSLDRVSTSPPEDAVRNYRERTGRRKFPKDNRRLLKMSGTIQKIPLVHNSKDGIIPESLEFSPKPQRQRMPRRSSMSAVSEVKLPGRGKHVKRRRSITFNDNVSVQQIVPAKSLSDEPERLWFNYEEYVKMKQKNLALVSSVDADGFANGRKYCTRGLEKYMMNPIERDGMKYGAWDSVLLEQKHQHEKGVHCAESIAQLYKWVTLKSMEEAVDRARLDAQEVAFIYKKENNRRAQDPRIRRRASLG